jgi:hypothetical protein
LADAGGVGALEPHASAGVETDGCVAVLEVAGNPVLGEPAEMAGGGFDCATAGAGGGVTDDGVGLPAD